MVCSKSRVFLFSSFLRLFTCVIWMVITSGNIIDSGSQRVGERTVYIFQARDQAQRACSIRVNANAEMRGYFSPCAEPGLLSGSNGFNLSNSEYNPTLQIRVSMHTSHSMFEENECVAGHTRSWGRKRAMHEIVEFGDIVPILVVSNGATCVPVTSAENIVDGAYPCTCIHHTHTVANLVQQILIGQART